MAKQQHRHSFWAGQNRSRDGYSDYSLATVCTKIRLCLWDESRCRDHGLTRQRWVCSSASACCSGWTCMYNYFSEFLHAYLTNLFLVQFTIRYSSSAIETAQFDLRPQASWIAANCGRDSNKHILPVTFCNNIQFVSYRRGDGESYVDWIKWDTLDGGIFPTNLHHWRSSQRLSRQRYA